jgi:K+-sensing histidine kinase KdpD
MDTQLAAIIVHDLKNALGVLEGELLQMTYEPDRAKAVQTHGTCVSLRDKLIGFLTLYKASSAGLTPRIEALNPEDFLNALVRHLVSARSDLSINIHTAKMPVVGFFDEHLVGLALEAALQNATRFARSAIEIGCREEDQGLVFSIRDDGAGLDAKEDKPSTGLGMALCNAIASAHCKDDKKGSASLGNHSQGGALFELRLP